MRAQNVVLGRIMHHGKAEGTGFFLDSKTFLTAKHVVATEAKDLNQGREKTVELSLDEFENIYAMSLNLVDAINDRVDCVLLKTEEVFEEADRIRLTVAENSLQGYECRIWGYPKELGVLIELNGQITIWEKTGDLSYDFVVSIEKSDRLQNYEGISGGPIMVGDNVIGIAVQQLSDSRIAGLSLKRIKEFLPEIYANKLFISTIRKDTTIHTIPIFQKCDLNFFETHLKQALQIAGPRYVSELNVENETFATINKILDKKGVEKELMETEKTWFKLYEKLCNSTVEVRDAEQLFSQANIEKIRTIIEELQIRWDSFINQEVGEEPDLYKKQLEYVEQELKNIFEEEKEQFEKKNGKGTYRNRSWKGFMASYMCSFPTYYLEELESAIELCKELKMRINKETSNLYRKKMVLLIGRGGMGKTHLLCDVVNQQIIGHMPAILFFGEQFGTNNMPEDVILKRLGLGQVSFDDFLKWLDKEAESKQCYIPICIDALNETTQRDYWNSQLPSLVAAVNNYDNIKLIVSCRSIYLKEVLDEDKIKQMAVVEQKGFEYVEIEAIRQFGEYYGIQLSFDYIAHQEYRNPLYLKMLCEVAKEQGNVYPKTEDLMNLMRDFFEVKDKKISRELSISIREHVVKQILYAVARDMVVQGVNYIEWKKLRGLVRELLEKYDVVGQTQTLLGKLLSENLLKESDIDDDKIVFGYERFYEIIMAQSFFANTVDETIQRVNQIYKKQQVTVGTLEMFQILFVRKFQQELLEYIVPSEWDNKWINSFGQSLYWRNNDEVTYETKQLVEMFLKNKDEDKVRSLLFAVLSVSTKTDFIFNAEYFHAFLLEKQPLWRDFYLSFFLLGNFNKEKTIQDICIRSQKLTVGEVTDESAFLWGITLLWLCSLNDICIRDNASKGLANLLCQYPCIILSLIKKFENVEEDYIQERLWQSVYSSLLLTDEETIMKKVVIYIKTIFVEKDEWPENVLIRDYLYKIVEYASKKKIISKMELETFKTPYKSEKLELVSNDVLKKWEYENRRLYFNCMDSDFATYTIPDEVEDYGFSKEEIGAIIMKNILDSGYNEKIEAYDQMIDYKYGSLRSRDLSVERIGKKYQKIFLYRCMGRIYDNYEYKPRYSFTENSEKIFGEHGTSFRTIDLTAIPYRVKKNAFKADQLKYLFSRYRDYTDEKWFRKKDVAYYFEPLFSKKFEDKDYLILQGYFRDQETKSSDYREMWVQIRSYLFKKEYKSKLLEWFEKKDFEGRWMPEGTNGLYEISIGEYPWSPYIIQYLREMEEEQNFRNIPAAPCYIEPTANDYNNEKDSEFCLSEITSKFMFPCKSLFEELNLKWDGRNGFLSEGKLVIYLSEGTDSALYIDKKILLEYLRQTEQEIVWTVLGEKRRINSMRFDDFPGRSEFSYSYFLDKEEVKMNHEVYNTRDARSSK